MIAEKALANFFGKEEILSFDAGTPARIQAFKLDGDRQSNQTRKELGLGSAHIADFLWVPGGKRQGASKHAYIIEATNLKQGLQDAIERYQELVAASDNEADEDLREKLLDAIIDKYNSDIRGEVFNKLYGTLLLFSRLGDQYSEAKELARYKSFTFVVIVPEEIKDRRLAALYTNFLNTTNKDFYNKLYGTSLVQVLDKKLFHSYNSFTQRVG